MNPEFVEGTPLQTLMNLDELVELGQTKLRENDILFLLCGNIVLHVHLDE